jgi:hypothetical protein
MYFLCICLKCNKLGKFGNTVPFILKNKERNALVRFPQMRNMRIHHHVKFIFLVAKHCEVKIIYIET